MLLVLHPQLLVIPLPPEHDFGATPLFSAFFNLVVGPKVGLRRHGRAEKLTCDLVRQRPRHRLRRDEGAPLAPVGEAR